MPRTASSQQSEYESATRDAFAYTALPKPATHIRLLKLERGRSSNEISCSLSTFLIDDAPSYAAISYTWGEPEPTRPITLDGFRVSVRENCHCALLQVQKLKWPRRCKPEHLWLDAICINQEDLLEKSSQVQLMGRIFKKAVYVFASLGLYVDDVLKLFQPWNNNRHPLRKRWYPGASTKARKAANLVLLNEFEALSRKAYFTRLWIVQELVLASEVYLLCGKYALRWRVLAELRPPNPGSLHGLLIDTPAQAYSNIISAMEHTRPFRVANSRGQNLLPLDYLIEACNMRHQRGFAIEFKELFVTFASWQCSDPRDHIYGCLSLIADHIAEEIRPDYSKTSFKLAKESLDFVNRSLEEPSLVQQVGLTSRMLSTLGVHSQNPEVCSEVELRRYMFIRHADNFPIPMERSNRFRSKEDFAKYGSVPDKWIRYQCKLSPNDIFQLHETESSDSLRWDHELDIRDAGSLPREYANDAQDEAMKMFSDYGSSLNVDNLRARYLTSGPYPIGLLCAGTRPGDWCILWHRKLQGHGLDLYPCLDLHPCLVIRAGVGLFEIIGQGLLTSEAASYRRRTQPSSPFFADTEVDICFSRTDWMTFLAQDLSSGSQGLLGAENVKLQLRRLFTSVTKERCSSFVTLTRRATEPSP